MVTDFRRIRHWKPSVPKVSWCVAAMAAVVGCAPFIVGVIVLFGETGIPRSGLESLAPGLAQAALYTLTQATLSALIVAFFSPVFAIGLFHMPIRWRRSCTALRTLSFCLPSIIVATGIILAWGNNGSATRFFESLGLSPPFSEIIYSPYAIVFANAIMNLPFASLMVFRGFAEIPVAQIESSALLGLSALSRWRYVAWPAIMPAILYFAGMTFLLSLGSFGALSILGGGPSSQTLEMAIFQSIFYDANWRGAAIFATAHTMLAGAASTLFVIPQYRWLNAYLSDHVKENTSETHLLQFIRMPFWTKSCSLFASMALDLLIAIPVVAIFADAAAWSFSSGATADLAAPLGLKSAQTSLTYAIPAAIISTISAFLVARAFCRYKDSHHPTLATAILSTSLASAIVPAMAAAFGILVIRSTFDTIQLGTCAIIGLHSTMILPFLISVILPRYGRAVSPFEQTKILNGVPDLIWAARVEWRIVGKTLAIALAIALSLSMNETAIVSMLGDPTSPALTTSMIQLMGHYHFGDAAVASCVLIIATAIPIWLTSREGERAHGPT